jgi:hypothetical protein
MHQAPSYSERHVLFDFSLFNIKEAAAQGCLFCEMLLKANKTSIAALDQLRSPHDLFLGTEIIATYGELFEDKIRGFGLWRKTHAKVLERLVFHQQSVCTTPGMSSSVPSPFYLSFILQVN